MTDDLDIKLSEIMYDGTKAEKYTELEDDPYSPFYKRTRAEVFLFAMAYAKRHQITPKKLGKQTKLPGSAFNTRMRILMRSIMIDEDSDVYAIRDNTKLRHMCEGYANAGIDELHSKVKMMKGGNYPDDILLKLIQS